MNPSRASTPLASPCSTSPAWSTPPTKSVPPSRTTSTAAPTSSTGPWLTPWCSSTTATEQPHHVHVGLRCRWRRVEPVGALRVPGRMTVALTARLFAVGALAVLSAALGGCSATRDQTPPPPAGPPRSGSVWVADEGADSRSVIDAATNAVAMTVTGIEGPHNVQVVHDGSVVYA